ncbi:helix-turn-helix transcriptional regulator [Thaumasiovibrio sp. DFM-14]|uniref:helix-turn-helix transcriptional regulator n=1 Tax=Thaumasiovibrio sp. DFM-14 TaxID=3384792 RepID=UPI00399F12B7
MNKPAVPTNSHLMSHEEVISFFHLKSRSTLYKWRKYRGFPNPLTLMPCRWERSAVMEWAQTQSTNI